MLSPLRSEWVSKTDVYVIYRGFDAIATVHMCPVFPDDPNFEDEKFIAQLRGTQRPFGEYDSLKTAMEAINEATK